VIALVRADNRLIHGQVLVTWVPHLHATRLLVADDEASRSPLARAAMTLALPPGLEAAIEPIRGVDWKALAASPAPTMVLVRDVPDLERAREGGLTPDLVRTLNIGNVHYSPGRRQITPSVFLSPEELAALRRLAAAGFSVEARALPLDAPVALAEIERRWAAAG
jgi:PTS system mannose-specific IIB component